MRVISEEGSFLTHSQAVKVGRLINKKQPTLIMKVYNDGVRVRLEKLDNELLLEIWQLLDTFKIKKNF